VRAVCRRVDGLYGTSAEEDCPGAEACKKWQTSRYCLCPRVKKRDGKPPRTVDLKFEQEACDHIERLVSERRSGLAPLEVELDEAERELIVMWEQREREHERLHMQNVADVAGFMRAWVKSLNKG
jgi:hypothetical protein